jgi:glycosyltransferase involved in cell wall biosynthesis
VSAWYPAPDEPAHGLFVRDQGRAAALRCDVTVLTRAAPGAPRDETESGVRVLRVLPASGEGLIANMKRLLAIIVAVRQLRREGHPPDLIHGHVYYAALLAVLVGRLYRIPVVVSEHYTGIVEGRLSLRDRLIARLTFRYADLVCPVSALLKQALVRLEPRGRYVVVRNAVDVDSFGAGPSREQPPSGAQLITVGGLFAKKGLPYLLDALRLLLREHPHAHLQIAGDGPDRHELESMAAGLPVAFLGECSRDEVAQLMQDADVLVMPSVVETFGIAPLEALAAGLPVVATTAFPVANVIAELGGLIVPPADPTALCEAVASVLAGQSHVRADAQAELQRRFGLKVIGRRWEAIYRSVINAPRSNRPRLPM